ncbi:RagB/SusD family nutrient uptake outer membrane protein [Parapedobacter sp. 10938]|uniref:RagB/SusD family nutrient uptake outer membrane protein n=1 Tax=Parapedobacter flavus TaxID=3110225 RepID=UPI002DB67062|nr:RagB/SusD family nutrient uptake outer membrane protein [Parapedobacter sp. 10938]MEC3878236.1 RagB/SusD family nutrient uptake outer membrane protein [Parapedobacter sp. 10938]
MKRKSTLYFSLLIFACCATSCEQWLDVKPSNQFDEGEQFETEQGYHDALIGIYQSMAVDSTYGADLGFKFIDVLAQLYQNKRFVSDYYGHTARYDYAAGSDEQDNPKPAIADIWRFQYQSIAHVNYLLKHLDRKPDALGEQRFGLVKGEALALRALLHFDLLRLYAPMYTESTASAPGIPYMEAFTVHPQERLTLDEVLARILDDLEEAVELQSVFTEIDPIAGNQGATSSELFLMFRQNRMNYWAAKALLARVYLYKGDKANALAMADEVINSQQFHFVNTASLNTDERMEGSNTIFSSEHIFSIYRSDLSGVADRYFKTQQTAAEASDLFSTGAALDEWYEVSREGYGVDIRSPLATANRWNAFNTGTVYTKKYYADHPSNVNQRLIPLIRLPEMYYIAAEAATSIDQALTYLNAVRTARLLPELTTATVTDGEQLESELFKEYRKEFYGEGQLWYYYKRHNYASIPNSPVSTMTPSLYTFPIPDDELTYNVNF